MIFKLFKWSGIFVLAVMGLSVLLLQIGVTKPVPPTPATKSIFDMTQAERKAAAQAREVAKYTPQERARWACSEALTQLAHVPDSLEWVRRSQWVTLERSGGWEVAAKYTARNRLGTVVTERKTCRLNAALTVTGVE